MRRIFNLSLILFAILAVSGMQSCKTTKTNTDNNYKLGQMDPSRTPNIEGTWILKSLNGQKAEDIFKGKIPSLTVDFTNHRVNGNGGCNTYGGDFTLTQGVFTVSKAVSTMMMCIVDNQEREYLTMLSEPNTASIVDGILTLKKNGKVVAEFTGGTDQATLLQGKWKLETMGEKDLHALFAYPDGLPTLEFKTAESSLGGNAGCNSYGSTYEINGDNITVGNIVSTRMACPYLEGESFFTQAISGTSVLSISQDQLTFSKSGIITLKFKKEK